MKSKKLAGKGDPDILMEDPEPYGPMVPLDAMNRGTDPFKPMKKCKK